MTDRHAAYIVVLAEDIREDDAEHVLNALRMVSGVVSVEPVVCRSAAVGRSRYLRTSGSLPQRTLRRRCLQMGPAAARPRRRALDPPLA